MIKLNRYEHRSGLVNKLLLIMLVVGFGVIGCSDSGDNPANPSDGGNGSGGDLRAVWGGDDGIFSFLTRNCLSCHGGNGGFFVSSYIQTLTRIDPGDPDNSLIIQRLEGTITPQMPANGNYLATTQIDSIRKWIADGATEN